MKPHFLLRPVLLLHLFMLGYLCYSLHLRTKPGVSADTGDYVSTAKNWDRPPSLLSSRRTPGYPLFLALFNHSPLKFLPLAFWTIAALWTALTVFFHGLRDLIRDDWTRALLCISIPVGTAHLFHFQNMLVSDGLATNLSILAMGLLLQQVTSPSPRFVPLKLTAMLFLCCITRPDRLYLIPFVPVMAVLLRAIVVPATLRLSGRFFAGLVLSTVIPYLAYCSLRKAAVNEFNFVSFGGTLVSATALQFLDEKTVSQLSADIQPFARELLKNDHSVPGEGYDGVIARHNERLWRLVMPTARRFFSDETLNPMLAKFGREVIVAHPVDYLVSIGRSIFYCLEKAWERYGGVTLVVCCALVLSTVLLGGIQERQNGFGDSFSWVEKNRARPALMLFVFAVGYFIAHCALNGILGTPKKRILMAGMVFLPLIPAYVSIVAGKRILKSIRLSWAGTRGTTFPRRTFLFSRNE